MYFLFCKLNFFHGPNIFMTVLTNLRFFVNFANPVYWNLTRGTIFQNLEHLNFSILCSIYLRSDYTWGSGGSSFTLETLPEENTSEFFKHQRVNKSVCVHIRLHSQSLLSGQGVRAARPFQKDPKNKNERERGNQDRCLDERRISIVISSVNITYRWTLRAGESSRSRWS